MGYFQKFKDRKKLKKRQRYEQNKQVKIRTFAEKHGVKPGVEYRFGSDSLPDLYLDLLKKSILADQVSMLPGHKLDTLR